MESLKTASPGTGREKAFVIAWIFGLIFYFLEYVIRSSPAVMITELSGAFGVGALGVSTILGTYYYTYSVTSLVAGIALDRAGARRPITVGIAILALGCFLFAFPSVLLGDAGRLLQGIGSAFAFTGCVYLASHGFAPRYIATAIGLTQCVGMLGGSAGQFIVGPLIHHGLPVLNYWIGIGIITAVTGILLFFTTPGEKKADGNRFNFLEIIKPYKIVFSNPQSYLSGLLSGLLFAPTTIFAMTWGVAFLQQDRAYDYQQAVLACSMVPLGWVIGCPLVGWISDLLGRRKIVLGLGILLMFLSFMQLTFFPSLLPVLLTMLVFGTASGVAMIPYTIIKEANPDQVKGSATGAINFMTFSITALLGPIYAFLYGKASAIPREGGDHFTKAGVFILAITLVALLVSFVIKETGLKSLKKLPISLPEDQ